MKRIDMKENRISLIIILVILILLVTACAPSTNQQPTVTTTPSPVRTVFPNHSPTLDQQLSVTITPSLLSVIDPKIKQIEESLPTRTPEPTPTPDVVDKFVNGFLEESGLSNLTNLTVLVENWANLLSDLLIFALIYFIGTWLVRIPLRWIVRRTPTEFDDQFFVSVVSELKFLVLVFSLNILLSRSTAIPLDWRQRIGDIFFILYLVTFAVLIWRLARFTERWYQKDMENKIGKDRYDTLSPLILRSIAVVMIILFIAIMLEHFGYQVSSFMIVGLVLLVAYIAVKFVIADAVNGFIILFDQPFRIGDRIQIESMDTWGEVIDVGTRTTRILTFDNRVLVIPNSTIANEQVDNYTYPDATYRMQLDIGIKFGSDILQVQDVLRSAISGVEGVLPEKTPDVLLIEFGNSGLIFRMRWWVPTQTDFYVMSNKINLAVIEAMKEAGIQVSFTTLNVINVQPESEEAVRLSVPMSSQEQEAS